MKSIIFLTKSVHILAYVHFLLYFNVVDLMLLKLLILSSDNKQAAEVAASVKNFLISIYRISEVIKCKSAAALSTIAATFCSIIIEMHRK